MMRKRHTLLHLASRSLRFYWRTNLSVLLGTVITTAVLVGAMLVGDSVRHSLHALALMRLGDIGAALNTQNRFFDVALGRQLEAEIGVSVAACLGLAGTLVGQQADGLDRRQLNKVQVLGVDDRFWKLAGASVSSPGRSQIALSSKVAVALGLRPGDEISLRVRKPTLLSRDAPLSSRQEKLSARGLLTVSRIVPDSELGRFSLEGSQVAPANVFVNRDWLCEKVDLENRANLLLVGGGDETATRIENVQSALNTIWRPGHAGISLRSLQDDGIVILESDRVFLDPSTSKTALGIDSRSVGALTYLVNVISRTDRQTAMTPYSFMVGVSPSDSSTLSPVPIDMQDDEIIASRWLADHLELSVGDFVTVRYFELGVGNDLVEKNPKFRVRAIREMDDLVSERDRAPAFPGLTDVESCRQWDVGMPMDEALLADADNEAYWNKYRTTPKAIVTLAAAQSMWANRFGDLSSVRYATPDTGDISRALQQALDPEQMGFFMLPVRDLAMAAVQEGMNFGDLFVGMSFFLIIAALMLTSLLFTFGVEQRSVQAGMLTATGFRPLHVLTLHLFEGGILAALGCLLGSLLGTMYTRILIWALGTHWQGAIAGAAIKYHAQPDTVVIGAISAFVFAVIALAVTTWLQTRRTSRQLIAGHLEYSTPGDRKFGAATGRKPVVAIIALAIALLAITYASTADVREMVMVFFLAGTLLLIAGIGMSAWILDRLCRTGRSQRLAVSTLGLRNAARMRRRSLTIVGLLAGGSFMVFAVSSMKEDVRAHAHEKWSGTGGFALFAESTIAVPDDLSSQQGRNALRLDDPVFDDMEVASMKVHSGDDASCFNLNRAQAPILLGVDPEAMTARRAFIAEDSDENVWELLNVKLPDGAVPALVADANTAMWGLEKAVGITKGAHIAYRDERGRMFNVKLVGTLPARLTVFQGRLLISKQAFTERFPSEEGHRMFLIDVPADRVDAIRRGLSERLARIGFDVIPAVDRLLEFYTVENTYLGMFLVLGGLGLLLGSVGLGVVVMRNVLERRSEFALLRCIGFAPRGVLRVVVAEHWLLVVLGLVIGIAASLAAMWPNLGSPGVDVPLAQLAGVLAGMLLVGLGLTAAAAHWALRGSLVNTLRNE